MEKAASKILIRIIATFIDGYILWLVWNKIPFLTHITYWVGIYMLLAVDTLAPRVAVITRTWPTED